MQICIIWYVQQLLFLVREICVTHPLLRIHSVRSDPPPYGHGRGFAGLTDALHGLQAIYQGIVLA